MKLALALTVLLALVAGCTSVSPKNDQQAVYAAGGNIAVALVAADAYQSLPDCATHAQPCSDAATVAKVQKAKVALVEAYKEADRVVHADGYSSSQWLKAQNILDGALRFLVAITPAVPSK